MKTLQSLKGLLLACLCSLAALTAQAERIKDMATIAGQRGNQLIGYGLVVGLDGTGENSSLNPMTGQSITNMLSALGVTLPSNQNLQMRNVATVMVTAELPGVNKEDIKVSVHDNVLSITGERKYEKEEKGKKYHRVERAYGSFMRSFTLPEDADGTKVTAEYKDGLLNVRVPKSEKAKPKTIEVKVA